MGVPIQPGLASALLRDLSLLAAEHPWLAFVTGAFMLQAMAVTFLHELRLGLTVLLLFVRELKHEWFVTLDVSREVRRELTNWKRGE